jgi:hypothetical protein
MDRHRRIHRQAEKPTFTYFFSQNRESRLKSDINGTKEINTEARKGN